MKLRFLVSLLIVFTLLYTPQNKVSATPTSSTWYVDQNAGGLNNGTSWTNAFNNLQDALGSASSGDEIYVAQGTYKPGANRSDTFQLVSGVQIYGGFPSGGGAMNQREWEVYETILSGDIGVSGDASDNSYHVVTTSGVIGPPSTVLNGFIIKGGKADGTGGAGTDRGAGIYNVSGYPQLGEILIVDNYA